MSHTDNQNFNRALTLVSSLLVSISAGTNYAFSAYSPQLGERLQLSSTTLNVIATSANIGMYVSSPFVGQIIDRIGPRTPLLLAAGFLFLGYGIVWEIFRIHPIKSPDQPKIPSGPITTLVLAFGMLLTGIGSSTALSSAAGGVARSFGPNVRATVIGITLAGFGLSAFFWAEIGHVLFSDDTASFLLLLGLGTSSLILTGACGMRSPIAFEQGAQQRHESMDGDPTDGLLRGSGSNLRPSDDHEDQIERSSYQVPTRSEEGKVDIYGRELIKTVDFWLLWIVMGCCCGSALMVINNIGTIIATLHFRQYGPSLDPSLSVGPSVTHIQSAQVSLLSVFNCFGRLFAGIISDALQSRYGLARVWWLVWVSGLFLTSQFMGFHVVTDLSSVSFLTGLSGFAYGNMYGTGPALLINWFGIDHFASNFGFLNLAPVVAGQFFNLSFGQIYDHHRSRSEPGELMCKLGQECYRDSFRITMTACGLALGLSSTLVYRHMSARSSDPDLRLHKAYDEACERTLMLPSPHTA